VISQLQLSGINTATVRWEAAGSYFGSLIARQARAVIGAVFRSGIADGKVTGDPTVALQRQLAAPNVTHRAAILGSVEFGGLLRAIEGMDAQPITRAALQLCALLAPRPGELRLAEWGEFDLDAVVWIIPTGRMKMRRPHASPLSPVAISILQNLHTMAGLGRFLFPHTRTPDRAMSDGTLNAALRRLGFTKDEVTSHGFRATFSTFANEAKQRDADGKPGSRMWDPDAIERQLAHGDDNEIRGAYNRSPYWDERVRLMTWWADECAAMARGAEILAFAKKA
jgi:integrase